MTRSSKLRRHDTAGDAVDERIEYQTFKESSTITEFGGMSSC